MGDCTKHGGDLIRLSELSKRSVDNILDFSVNIRPDGMPDFLQASFLRAINHCERYPSPHAEEAKRAAANFFGIDKNHFVFGNGSNEILHAMIKVLAENGYGQLCVFEPAFSEYSIAAKKAGMEVISLQIPLPHELDLQSKIPVLNWDSFDNSIDFGTCDTSDTCDIFASSDILDTHEALGSNGTHETLGTNDTHETLGTSNTFEDLDRTTKNYDFSVFDDIIQNIPSRSVIIFANPSNPSGMFIPLDIYRKWVQKRKDCIWVFDEAFIDYVRGNTKESAINIVSENCMILRSLTKFYSIASLRIGYLVCDTVFAEKLQNQLPAWNVNGIALACATTIFAQDGGKIKIQEDAERTIKLNERRKLHLYSLLQRIDGIHIYPSQGNFVLFSLPNAPANFWERLLVEYGISIRNCSNYTGLETGNYFRVAVRFPLDHEKLLKAIQEICTNEFCTGAPCSQETKSSQASIAKKTPALMLLGTSSNAGKSILAAAFCRIFTQDGFRVKPFKAQNMSLNSGVTALGDEMGRAQIVQAQAARVDPDARMNPILLKPHSDTGSQVVLLGKAVGHFHVRDYYAKKSQLWKHVCTAYDELAQTCDIMVLEGAGSPAEVNLKDSDIVNIRMAQYAQASSLLVGDIDRGGIYASFLGTWMTLTPNEEKTITGYLVNRFRGDASLLASAHDYVLENTGKPVLGVIPYIHDLKIPEEDMAGSMWSESDKNLKDSNMKNSHIKDTIEKDIDGNLLNKIDSSDSNNGDSNCNNNSNSSASNHNDSNHNASSNCENSILEKTQNNECTLSQNSKDRKLDIAIIQLAHISNHTDFEPLGNEPQCNVRSVRRMEDWGNPDIVILPGSKSVTADLATLDNCGLLAKIREHAQEKWVFGICGGLQMMGCYIYDPLMVESKETTVHGLGLINISSEFAIEKILTSIQGVESPLGTLSGYEIHHGISKLITHDISKQAFCDVQEVKESFWHKGHACGYVGAKRWATYLHGLFDEDEFRHAFLNFVREDIGLNPMKYYSEYDMEKAIDQLADVVRNNVDMPAIYRSMGIEI